MQVPGADKLPKPEDVVASAYDFAEQLLQSQRKFAEEVLKATTSLTAGHRKQQVSHRPAARRRGPVPNEQDEHAAAPDRRRCRVIFSAR